MSEEDIKRLQSTGGDHLAATEKNILGNDLERIWEIVSSWKQGGRIDFVLDNAGFELYCDLVYADWLLQTGICNQVRFHGKRIPWFVVRATLHFTSFLSLMWYIDSFLPRSIPQSDVTRKDWSWLLNIAVYGHLFVDANDDELASLKLMAKRWKKYEQEGKIVYEQHPFWCTGYTFWSRKCPLHLSQSKPF